MSVPFFSSVTIWSRVFSFTLFLEKPLCVAFDNFNRQFEYFDSKNYGYSLYGITSIDIGTVTSINCPKDFFIFHLLTGPMIIDHINNCYFD